MRLGLPMTTSGVFFCARLSGVSLGELILTTTSLAFVEYMFDGMSLKLTDGHFIRVSLEDHFRVRSRVSGVGQSDTSLESHAICSA